MRKGARGRGGKAARGGKGKGKATKQNKASEGTEELSTDIDESYRTASGVLTSLPHARDIKIEQFSLALYGQELITDSLLEFNFGRRYGLIGLNGTGKSAMLKAIGKREVPMPKNIDIYYVDREISSSDMTALEAVIADADKERRRLEAEIDDLVEEASDDTADLMADIYEKLEALDVNMIKVRAALILHGLGFTPDMQNKQTKDFSGGWRMRIALAKALFVNPTMLLLDEPTNHLDLEACVWLEEYLQKKFVRGILVIVSHSQDFLNGVCTNIIHLKDKQLTYYGGNFDSYIQAREELEVNQMKKFNWEQDQIAHMKDYIARFGHGSAKLARQAKSKEKVLAKMEASGLTNAVVKDKVLTLRFENVGELHPPVLQFQGVCFGYNGDKNNYLYKNLDFGIDLQSRIALVGPNGVGKSTLLNLMCAELVPTDGMVKRNNKLRIGVYRQHLTDVLDGELSPLEYLMKEFPEEKSIDKFRQNIGKFGLTGKSQVSPIKTLSDGQKCRVVFAWLAWREPHMLLLDEPTNHLDIETIDSLAEALNEWDGGLVLVSHDFRLINQVAKEIWLCEKQGVSVYKGSIENYKKELASKVAAID
eukprot:TRINITY_DN4723_c0_g1_i1.p1 TRINITY_DN4723_c0_g1~~TRINITY_DN4723_c0_g1_i1.p1  ORF type:complete len:593 (-),score=156.94 TRINITY_DN4723_c0_g1_i1:49-1827(-)